MNFGVHPWLIKSGYTNTCERFVEENYEREKSAFQNDKSVISPGRLNKS